MTTLAGTQDDAASLIKTLLNLEHDALAAYDETVQKLENKDAAAKVEEFRQDHLQHIDALQKIAETFDLWPEDAEGTMKSFLTTGKIALAKLVGDQAILKAMSTNENDTLTAYERAAMKNFITPDMKSLFEKAYADERRHREWMLNKASARAL